MHPTSASYLSDLFIRISSEHVYCAVQCCTRLTKTPWIKEEIKKKVHAVRIFWLVLCRLFVCPLSTSNFPHPPFPPSGSTYGTANVLEPTTVKPVYCNTYCTKKRRRRKNQPKRIVGTQGHQGWASCAGLARAPCSAKTRQIEQPGSTQPAQLHCDSHPDDVTHVLVRHRSSLCRRGPALGNPMHHAVPPMRRHFPGPSHDDVSDASLAAGPCHSLGRDALVPRYPFLRGPVRYSAMVSRQCRVPEYGLNLGG